MESLGSKLANGAATQEKDFKEEETNGNPVLIALKYNIPLDTSIINGLMLTE